MSETQTIAILGTVVSLLITIIGYFLHRLISGVDDGLKNLKEEVYRDRTILTRHIDRLQTEIQTLSSTSHGTKVSLEYIQKKVDDIQKIQETVSDMSKNLVAAEVKLENLGKIIYVGQGKKTD